jgi:hypothetical protein
MEQWNTGMMGSKELRQLKNDFSAFYQYSTIPTFHYSMNAKGIRSHKKRFNFNKF